LGPDKQTPGVAGRDETDEPGLGPVITRRTVFYRIPKSIPFVRRHLPLQVLVNLLLFSAPPTIMFWYWMLTEVMPALRPIRNDLLLAMVVASIWITVGPIFMQIAEFIEDRWFALVKREAAFGWNITAMHGRIIRANRLNLPLALVGGVLTTVSLALALPDLSTIIPIEHGWAVVAGFAVIAQVGFTSTSGLIGAYKAIATSLAATRGVRLNWTPYGSWLSATWSSYWMFGLLGVMFSTGAVFIPSLLFVESGFHAGARVIVWAFIVLLSLGGVGMFLVPTTHTYQALRRARNEMLSRLDTPIDTLLSQIIECGAERRREALLAHRQLSVLLAARREIEAVRLLPSGHLITNIVITIIVPLASLALSAAQSL
jgi:hypothetical protein